MEHLLFAFYSCLYIFSFCPFSNISNTVFGYSHRCFRREFEALSFDNNKGFNHRDNREGTFKILRGPFFLGHPLVYCTDHLSDNKTELLPGFLTDHIACELGLSNGTQGIFRELVYDDQEDPVTFNTSNAVFPPNTIYVRKPLYALVEINSSQVETSLDGLQPKLIPISLAKKDFSISIKQLFGPLLEQRSGRKAPDIIHVARTQLPIVPAFAITTYKAQGLTMGKIVVNLQARLDELDRKTQRDCAHFTF